MKRSGNEWIKAALIRALRTMAQTALSMLTIGMAISDVDWLHMVSVTIVAGVISILTSFATGLPEATTEGKLIVNTDADKDGAVCGLKFDKDLTKEDIEKLVSKGSVNFRVTK